MSVTEEEASAAETVVLEYALDAPPEKVWRAVSIPAFRERWLPDADLACPDPVSAVEGREISFRMRDDAPPYGQSLVTFDISADGAGGTRFRIVQRLAGTGAGRPEPRAANGNRQPLMLAA